MFGTWTELKLLEKKKPHYDSVCLPTVPLFIRPSAVCLHGVLNCILFWKEFQCTLQKPCKIMRECSANFFQTIFCLFAYIFLYDSEIQRRGMGGGLLTQIYLLFLAHIFILFCFPPHPRTSGIPTADYV